MKRRMNEILKVKQIKYLIIIITFLVIILSMIFILFSEKELKLMIENKSNKEFRVSFQLFEGNEDDFFVHGREADLNAYESYTSHFKFDSSRKIFKVLIRVWDSSHSMGDPNIYQYYSFPNDEIYDLLAVIDNTGRNMTIVKMSES